MNPSGPSANTRGRALTLVLLLTCFAALRLRFLEVPLERDEGE